MHPTGGRKLTHDPSKAIEEHEGFEMLPEVARAYETDHFAMAAPARAVDDSAASERLAYWIGVLAGLSDIRN
jgi:hypothetical protein